MDDKFPFLTLLPTDTCTHVIVTLFVLQGHQCMVHYWDYGCDGFQPLCCGKSMLWLHVYIHIEWYERSIRCSVVGMCWQWKQLNLVVLMWERSSVNGFDPVTQSLRAVVIDCKLLKHILPPKLVACERTLHTCRFEEVQSS